MQVDFQKHSKKGFSQETCCIQSSRSQETLDGFMAILLIWECNHCLRNWAQTRSEHVSIRLISRDKVGDAPQSHFEWSDNRSHCNWRQPVAQPMGSQLNSQAMSANFAARSKSRPGGVSSRPRARFNFLLLNLIRPFSQKNTGNRWKQQTDANSWKMLKERKG